MRLEITAFGETLMRRDMLRFADNLAVPVLALEAVGDELLKATERQFDTEGGNSGGWQPLLAETIREKLRKGYPETILVATGALKSSLTSKDDAAHIQRLSGTSLAFGSTVSYAIYHATGTSRGLPRRPPVALSEVDRVRMVKIVQEALVADVRAAGGMAERLAMRSSFFRAAA